MALLAGTLYDPGSIVSKATSALLAMTAIDTTNLRLSFTVPSNGAVLVRIRTLVSGSTTAPQVLLGVLESATVKGRVAPIGAQKTGSAAAGHFPVEALFVVSGLTPSASLTWDAAYGVELVSASTNIKYGGPDDASSQSAFGGFVFEIWEAPNLLGAVLYDPGTAVTKSCTSLLAMTALDTTNLRITFTAPASGKVLVRLKAMVAGSTTYASILLGVLDGATVKGRQSPVGAIVGMPATLRCTQEALFVVTGLTPTTSYTWDAAYGVEIVLAGTPLKYGGPDDTTSDNAWGAFQYEIWEV